MRMAEESQKIPSSSMQHGPRSMGEIQQTLMEPTPLTTTRQSLISKQEPMDSDSGTATGTEFGSSSPESDRSDNLNLYKTIQIQPVYTNQHNLSAHSIYKSERFPLMPANSAPMTSPMIPIRTENSDSPQHNDTSSPPVEDNMVKTTERIGIKDNQSKLQKALGNETCFLSAGFSPKSSGSVSETVKSDKLGDNCHDKNLTNSQGKVKKFKCKQCDFFSMSKLDYWEHIKTHMEPGKALSCPHCPFVTQFKHHLLYHLRNHDGLKPFKCDKCSYSGVNRSMLNSHMKSHSNIYQYRCANCPFASKYIHSLKIHLRKNSHSPGMVLNADGTPNPLSIIDVYGTSRGPKIEITEQKRDSPMLHNAANMPISFTGFPHFPGSLNGIPNAYLRKMENMRSDIQAVSPESNVSSGSPPDFGENESRNLDPSNRGAPNENDSSEDDDEKEDRRTYTTIFDNVEVVDNSPMEEGDGSEDESETLNLNVLESEHIPTIVTGTRRGPKIKNPGHKPALPNPDMLPVPPFSLNHVLATAANMSIRFPGFSFYTGFLNGSSSPLMMEIERLTRKMQAVSSLQYGPSLNSDVNEGCVLDLS